MAMTVRKSPFEKILFSAQEFKNNNKYLDMVFDWLNQWVSFIDLTNGYLSSDLTNGYWLTVKYHWINNILDHTSLILQQFYNPCITFFPMSTYAVDSVLPMHSTRTCPLWQWYHNEADMSLSPLPGHTTPGQPSSAHTVCHQTQSDLWI